MWSGSSVKAAKFVLTDNQPDLYCNDQMYNNMWMLGHCVSTRGVLTELQRAFQAALGYDALEVAGDAKVVGCSVALFIQSRTGKKVTKRIAGVFVPTSDIGLRVKSLPAGVRECANETLVMRRSASGIFGLLAPREVVDYAQSLRSYIEKIDACPSTFASGLGTCPWAQRQAARQTRKVQTRQIVHRHLHHGGDAIWHIHQTARHFLHRDPPEFGSFTIASVPSRRVWYRNFTTAVSPPSKVSVTNYSKTGRVSMRSHHQSQGRCP